MSNKLYLIFYEPSEELNTMRKRLLSKIQDIWEGIPMWKTRNNHVELVARLGDKSSNYKYITYGIDQKKMHRSEFKLFTNNGYKTFYVINLSKESFDQCIKHLDHIHYEIRPDYDWNSEYRFIPLGIGKCFGNTEKKHDTYFCSELICEALQYANVLDDSWEPIFTTPQMLWNWSNANLKSAKFGDIPFIEKKEGNQSLIDQFSVIIDIDEGEDELKNLLL